MIISFFFCSITKYEGFVNIVIIYGLVIKGI